jgi:hypothetical protein
LVEWELAGKTQFTLLLLLLLLLLRPPLWSSGQSSWLQIEKSGLDSGRYQIFWEVVGLERVPLSLVSTIEEPLGRKSSFSGLESREYGRRDPSRWSRGTLYPQKLALTSPISGGRSVGIVRSRTQATEFSLLIIIILLLLLLLYSPFLGLGHCFSFLNLYTDGRVLWTEDQHVAR